MSSLLKPTLRDLLAQRTRPQFGVWICSGGPVAAEICAGAGLDWLLIDMEHTPVSLESLLVQLQAIAAYPVTPVVRVPSADAVTIKRVLDLGAQTLIVPSVSSASEAEAIVQAVKYPPLGKRGVGSALARSARWNRIDNYLQRAETLTSVFVQIETREGVDAAKSIAAVEGIDGIYVGPSDLAASLGHLGQQTHPEVQSAVRATIAATLSSGKPVGVNAFDPAVVRSYTEAGASFFTVSADVALLARGTEHIRAEFIGSKDTNPLTVKAKARLNDSQHGTLPAALNA